ncbi:hypothetical protein F949_00557 [Acinetobacter junii NIPH 182]|nr:hypothetical protein F949_00557 [Acinetobacter junii NIPH 182]
MQQAIVGFHLDEEILHSDAAQVADLACGHTQHVAMIHRGKIALGC